MVVCLFGLCDELKIVVSTRVSGRMSGFRTHAAVTGRVPQSGVLRAEPAEHAHGNAVVAGQLL